MGERRIVKGWIVERGPDGRIVPIAPAGQSGPPRDPTFDLQAPKVQADIASSQAGTRRTNTQIVGDTLANETASKNLVQNPISKSDQDFINAQRGGAESINKLIRDIEGGAASVDRFQTAPGKGVLYGAGTPTDDDYPTTALAKKVVGGFLPDQGQEDYQRITGLQNSAVLAGQQDQKGVQTEGDALRQKLANVSPNKDVRVNAQILADARFDAGMAQQRPSFYTYWANQLGSLNALNKDGKSVDQVWNEEYQKGMRRMRQQSSYTGRRGPPRRGSPQGGSFLGWEE